MIVEVRSIRIGADSKIPQRNNEMAFIIIKNRPYRFGRNRSEQEKNLRKEGMATMTDEQLDKCKFLEKKSDSSKSFFDQSEIGKVK